MSGHSKASRSRRILLAAAGLAAAGLANRTMATINYFDANSTTAGFGITNGNTYSWESSDWSTSSTGVLATTTWTAGSLAEFNGTASSAMSYTVTVGTTESDAGIFLTPSTTNGVTLNVNQSGTGSLSIASGLQGFACGVGLNNLVLNVPMSGTGGVEQEGSGQLSLYGNNSFSGGVETTGGQELNYNNNNSFGTGSIFITGASGGALVKSGSNQLTIANNWSWGNATSTTLMNLVSGGTLAAPGVIFSGSVTLSAAATTIANFQTGTNGNVTEFSGAITGAAPIVIEASSGTGYGTIIFAGTSTYTNTTTISNGTSAAGTAVTLAAGASNALSAKSAFTDNSILNLQGFDQTIGSLAGSGTVMLGSTTEALLALGSNNGSTTFSGLISGTGSGGGLNKVGTGTFTLSSTNGSTFLGNTTVTTGVLEILQDNDLGGNSSGTVTIGTGKFWAGASFSSARNFTMNSGTSTIDALATDGLTLTGSISGTGGLTKGTNLGTVVLNDPGNSTYTGATAINGGVLQAGASNVLASTSAFTVGGGALNLLGFDQTIGALAGTGTVNLGVLTAATLTTGGKNTSTTFSGSISGTSGGGLVKVGTGTFTLNSTNGSTFLGDTTVNGGTLSILQDNDLGGNASANLNIGAATFQAVGTFSTARQINLNNAASTIDATSGATLTITSAVSGTGGLTKGTNLGTVTLNNTGNSLYGGATTINGGTLAAGDTNVLASTSAFTVNAAGTLALNGFDQTIGSLAGAGTVDLGDGTEANLTLGGNNTSTVFSGTISGTGTGGGLFKVGSGTFALTSTNGSTFLGDTTVSGGTLSVVQDNDLGGNAAGNVNVGAATFLAAGTFTTGRTINLNDPASILDASAGNTMTIAGAVTGSNGLTKGTSTGTIILTSSNNTFSGLTTVQGGELSFQGNATGAGSVSIASGATLDVTLATITTGDVTNNGTFQLSQTGSNGGAATIGLLSGSGLLILNPFSSLNTAGGTQGTLSMNTGTLTMGSTGLAVNNATLDGGSTLVGPATNGLGSPTGPGLYVVGSLSLPASLNMQKGAVLSLYGSATVSNPISVAGDANTEFYVGPTGSLTYAGGSNQLSLLVTTNVDGTINANSGTIYMQDGGTHNGMFNVATNATLAASGHFTTNSTVNDNGTFILGIQSGAPTYFEGTANVNPGATLGLSGFSTVAASATLNFASGDNLTNFVNQSATFLNNQVMNVGAGSLGGNVTFRNAGVSFTTLTYGDGTQSPQNLAFETGGTVTIGTYTQNGNILTSGLNDGHPTTLSIGTFNFGSNSIAMANINVTTAMNWTGGILDGGDGTQCTVTVEPGATFYTDGTGIIDRGAILNNLGTLVASNGLTVGMLTGSDTAQLNLQGSSTATVGSILRVGTGGLLSSGSIQAQLNITDNASLTAAIVQLNSGELHITSQGQASLDGLNANDAVIDSGTLTISSTPAAGEDPVLAGALVGGYQHDGAMYVNGGSVTTPVLNLGVTPGYTGTYVQSGGTVTVSSALLVGQSGGGNGNMTISGGSFTVTGGTALIDTNGLLNVTGGSFTAGALTGAGATAVGGGSAAATVNLTSFQQSSLSIAGGGYLALPTNTIGVTNIASAISITGSGVLNLANSGLITSTSPSTVRQYLVNGFNGGAWNGTGGINSSNAAADYTSNGATLATRALGYTSGTSTVGAGLGLATNQTLVKFTIYGDADLSGGVDISDLNIVLNNFLGGNTWDTGDMYYSGSTDISDLNAVLNNFFASAPVSSRPLSLAKAHAGAASVSTAHTLTGTASPDANPPTPAFNTLELVVNTSSGDVQIIGNNTQTGDTQITSSSNGIITANWHDLKSQGFSNWQDTAKKAFGIGEFDTQFAATGDFALINDVDYGNIYNTTANAEDYIFKYGAVDQTTGLLDTLTGSVFYVSGVPEPTTLSLLGIGAAGLLARRRRKEQSR